MPVAHSVPTALRFRGLPAGVECVAPLQLAESRNHKPHTHLFLALPDGEISPSSLRVFNVTKGISRLWFPLPAYTRPGTYKGNVRIDSTDYPIAVEVEAYENLLLSPPHMNVVASPGEQMTAHLSLANGGNVPCQIGKAYAIGLYDVEGAERAVGATFREPDVEGKDKMSRLMDHLADEHAGIVRVQVHEGEGAIAPGEVRELALHLRFPDNMKPGRSYTGSWVLYNLAYQVRVAAHTERRKEHK